MTIEEKLQEAKRLYESANDDQRYVMERLFPELKESEGEKIRKELIKETKSSEVRLFEIVTNEEFIAWLEKQSEQKPAEWSSRDDSYFEELTEASGLNELQIEWLTEIKDRVQPQPKQEWSEEDEEIFNELIAYFIDDVFLNHTEEDIVNWLKSLKDRYAWKPSDEQLNALDSTLQYSQVSHNSFEHLNSLFNDLKKLK